MKLNLVPETDYKIKQNTDSNQNENKDNTPEKSISPKSDIYPIDLYFIQCQALDDFSTKIPKDYVYYNQVIGICNKIKDSLGYTAPEELMTYWKTKGNLRLIQYMPNPPTPWVYEAWTSINQITKLYG